VNSTWASRIRREYGLHPSGYNQMLVEQNKACAICKKPVEPNKKLNVDHCHKSQKVRGLLCFKCNTILGLANDDPSILTNAISYLNKHYDPGYDVAAMAEKYKDMVFKG
jgi:hypothetical protein